MKFAMDEIGIVTTDAPFFEASPVAWPTDDRDGAFGLGKRRESRQAPTGQAHTTDSERGFELFIPPTDYARVKVVTSFDALVTTPFAGDVNAVCWVRSLPGDFDELAEQLRSCQGRMDLTDSILASLTLTAAGRTAADMLLRDQDWLRALGVSPSLECISDYLRDDPAKLIATDVYSFHVDRAPVAIDTYLCSYNAPTSEILRNDEAQQKIDIPEIRAKLLDVFEGADDAEFNEYLADNCFDLHYLPGTEARPISCGVGNLWRLACQYPGCPVPPCIHRAPVTVPGQPPRLLLIS